MGYRVSHIQHSRGGSRRAFTLIELVVVLGIIVLLVAIAVPAVGPALNSNQQTQAVQMLTNAITLAQTRAANKGGYAIRIERAFKTDDRGYMVDANGQTRDNFYAGRPNFNENAAPVWLDHQQIRFLNPPKDGRYYQPALDEPIALPRNTWFAPDYALQTGFLPKYFILQNADVPSAPVGSPVNSSRTNPFHTFCIVFDQQGNVIQLRSTIAADNYFYFDSTRPDSTLDCPQSSFFYNSALGVILYDHSKLEQYGTNTSSRYQYLSLEGRMLYINRFLGTLVETRNQ